jgi:G3E family GTPase
MMQVGPDFVVLTGFLGSGKTTLLRDFLGTAEAADTAVIVNEVGEIGLDGVILRESGGDVRMAMLSNGCVCCQMGSDLATTIDLLLSAERPDASGPLRRIILETSGLSKPGPVLRQLTSLAEYRMRVSVVATYDALRGTEITAFEEAAAQWGAAHRIVLTKADTVSPERLAAARAEIAGLNPLAETVITADRPSVVAAAFAPLAAVGAMPELPPADRRTEHARISVRLLRPRAILAYDDLAAWLDNLAGVLGERLLRLKGLVRIIESDRPVLVQSVGTLFSPPRPISVDPANSAGLFLVLIARDIEGHGFANIAPPGLFELSPLASGRSFRRTPAAGRFSAEAVRD